MAAKRVLVIDDDQGVRDLLAAVLEDEGYSVETASDGAEGLERAAQSPPDVILLDFSMPRCDGPTFAERYRAHSNPAPIVLLTASHEVRARCRQVDAQACVGKPFQVDHLLHTIEHLEHAHSPAA